MADDDTSASLSIGAVSRATGIPAATLRTWERRYGFPDPARSDSGHRRYVPDVIDRLQLIDKALDQGCRPSDVVGLSESELDSLVSSSPSESPPPGDTDLPDLDRADSGAHGERDSAGAENDTVEWLDRWMDAVRDLDGRSLRSHLRSQWNQMGGLEFLEQRISPLLVRIGQAWRDGNLEIAHEHHVSEQLQDFLSSRWRPLSERASGPAVVCATVPGEDHVIGLHIAALVLAMANWRVIFLGPRTPTEDIASAATENEARAAMVSFSANFDQGNARRTISTIRSDLDETVDLIAGGMGAPDSAELPKGVHSFDSLKSYYDWAFETATSDTTEPDD